MIGKTLALVNRALRVDARGMPAHLFRGALGVVMLIILYSTYESRIFVSAPGLQLFGWISVLNFWFITFAGVSFFASAITEEKEERTLGLLKMAGIDPLALLLGKWIPRLIGAGLLIAIQIPFTMLSITLGGVLWHQILAAYLALFAHLFFVGNLGLMASVLMPRTGSACGMTIVMLLLQNFLPLILLGVTGGVPFFGPVTPPSVPYWGLSLLWDACKGMLGMSALVRLSEVLSTGFNGSLIGYQFLSNAIAGSVLFAISWLVFERCTRNDVEPGAESLWMRRMRTQFRPLNSTRPWEHPLVWKDFQYTSGGWPLLIGRLVGYGVLIFGFVFLISLGNYQSIDRDFVGGTSIVFSLILLVAEAALMATRLYRNELTQKTWGTLCLLPRTMPELAYPKLAGGLVSLVPALAWLCFGVLCCPKTVEDFFVDVFREPATVFACCYVCLQVLLGIFLAAYLSVAMPWGIWPVAIFASGFILVMSNVMLATCLFPAGPSSGAAVFFFIFDGISFALMILVHVLIGQKLSARAAED